MCDNLRKYLRAIFWRIETQMLRYISIYYINYMVNPSNGSIFFKKILSKIFSEIFSKICYEIFS